MTQFTVHDIQRDPLGFVHRIESGERLRVVRDNVAIAEIMPLPPTPKQARPYGLAAGEFTVPDDFDQPLPDDVLKLFEGA